MLFRIFTDIVRLELLCEIHPRITEMIRVQRTLALPGLV